MAMLIVILIVLLFT